MATWHFQTHINADGALSVPPEVAAQVGANQVVHVVLVAGESAEEADWRRLAVEQFLEGYGPGDEIYDRLNCIAMD